MSCGQRTRRLSLRFTVLRRQQQRRVNAVIGRQVVQKAYHCCIGVIGTLWLTICSAGLKGGMHWCALLSRSLMIPSIGKNLLLAWVSITNTQQPANVLYTQSAVSYLIISWSDCQAVCCSQSTVMTFSSDRSAQIAFNTSLPGMEEFRCLWPGCQTWECVTKG